MAISYYPTMKQFLEKFLEDMPRSDKGLTSPTWIPPVDAWEDQENFYLVVDLPGVEKEQVNIKIENDELTISGERKEEEQPKFLRNERPLGKFVRSFSLESPIDREKVKATYKMGVLKVTLPKKEELKPKTIEIEVME
jgi:HSP20 family protein